MHPQRPFVARREAHHHAPVQRGVGQTAHFPEESIGFWSGRPAFSEQPPVAAEVCSNEPIYGLHHAGVRCVDVGERSLAILGKGCMRVPVDLVAISTRDLFWQRPQTCDS